MNVRKLVKRITALGIGATMLGATIFGAAAADLSQFPKPLFVDPSTGVVNSLFVVGENSKSIDTMGMSAVVSAIQAAAVKKVAVGNAKATVTYDNAVKLDLSNDKINMDDSFTKERLTSSDLDILKDGTFEDDDGSDYDYTQTILLGSTPTFTYYKYDSSEDPALGINLASTTSTNYLYDAKVNFVETVNFTSSASKGQTIELFGKEYTVADDTDSSKLVLYGSSTEKSLKGDETTTITVGGKEYTIQVVGFSTSGSTKEVILNVNGDTRTIKSGNSKKVGGIDIFAKEVSTWNSDSDGLATLQIGAEKYTFEDGEQVQVGDSNDAIDGTEVSIGGSVGAMTSLEVKVYRADSDHDFIKVGDEYLDPVFGTFKLTVPSVSDDLKASDRDKIELGRSGDTDGYVTVTDSNGKEKQISFAHIASTGSESLADDDGNAIHVVEGATASEDEYIYLTPGADKEQYTHFVKVDKIYADNDSNSDDYVRFKDVFTGDTYETDKFNYQTTSSETTTLTVDGFAYTVNLDPSGTNPATPTNVSVTYDDSKTVVFPAIELKNGETFAITDDASIGDVLTTVANNTRVSKHYILPTGDLYIGVTDNNVSSASGDTNTYEYSTDGSSWSTITTTDGSAYNSMKVGEAYYAVKVTADETGAATTLTVNNIAVDANQDSTAGAQSQPGVLFKEEDDESSNENVFFIESNNVTSSSDHYLSYNSPYGSSMSSAVNTEDSDVTNYYTGYGTFFVKDTSGDNSEVQYDIYYPDEEMYFNAFMAGASAKKKESVSGSYSEVPVQIPSTLFKFDSDVKDPMAQSMVVVGGPCVNSVAAALLGNPKECTSGFEQGKAMIKLFDSADGMNAGKVAMLVAGYSGQDTKRATDVLANYKDYADQLKGKEVVVSGTTSGSISVSAPEVTTTTTTASSSTSSTTTTTQAGNN